MPQTITFDVALGDEVRDRVTGFTGVVVAVTEWFNRCQRATVQPPVDKEGKSQMAESFDVEQLEVVAPAKVTQKPVPTNTKQPGGPMPSISRGQSVAANR